ncbi:MAG: LLM class flavin-dependent oxidoreductase, partial [Ilumatobacteraceae bacterium]
GVDTVWSAEAWGTDAFVPLAYVAARTSRIRLATGIAQVTARAAVMTAMTAMTLDRVSNGRVVLGLGVSGPQVVEGLHGQRYRRPLERLRETVDVVRLAFAGERIEYHGKQIELPLPGGEGKALRLVQPARPHIPIHLATLGPLGLEYTGATADGWVGTCFVPERAHSYLDHIRTGAASAGRSMAGVEICAGGPVAFTQDVERVVASRKKALAFQVSAMGSPTTNFYFDAYARMGYEEVCARVRSIYLAGRRDDAADAVPDELPLGTSLFGTDEMVRDRIRAYRDAGVTDLRVEPLGRTSTEKLDTLAHVLDLVRQVTAEPGATESRATGPGAAEK